MRKKFLPTVGRGLWYVCGFILLLSLPTFSYLVPTLQGPTDSRPGQDAGGFVAREGEESGSNYAPASDRFVRSKTGGGFSSSSYLGIERRMSTDRTRRIRASRATPRSQRGLDRLSRERQNRTKNPFRESERPTAENSVSTPSENTGETVSELVQMEQDYQSTLSYLFPTQPLPFGSRSDNSFQSALDSQGGGGAFDNSGDGEGSPDDGAGDSDGSGDTGSDEGEGGSGSSDSDDGSEGEPESARIYDHLIVGDFSGTEGGETVFRAAREGAAHYVLETGIEVSFLPGSGVVGIPQRSFNLSDGEMILSADFSGDGIEDIVVAGWEYPASFIRGYVRRGQFASEPDFEAVLQFVKVTSIAAHDFESDGKDELAVLFGGNPNLVVYKVEDGALRYSRELAVPFEPVILAASQDQGIFHQRYLQVFEENLLRSISFSSRFPGVYSFSQPSSFRSVRKIKLDSPDESTEGEEFSLLIYDDVIVVVELRSNNPVFLAGFKYSRGYPKLAIGRSEDDGSREIVFVPKGS